jgi:hypothetical protein
MGPQPPSSSKTNYSLFAQLSRIARGGLASREALSECADECYGSLAYCRWRPEEVNQVWVRGS